MINSLNKYIETIQEEFGPTEYVKLVKTGKEAEVHLLMVDSEYAALKVYKDNQKFSSRGDYFDLSEIGDKRRIRAAKKKTRTGINTVNSLWSNREYSVMEQLKSYSANIPIPYLNMGKAMLMEYLGEGEKPAPRLVDLSLTNVQARSAFEIIIYHIELFLEVGFVHGDLSSFNILWHNELPYIIDFPQIVYLENKNAKHRLNVDIKNIESYFKRYEMKDLELRLKSIRI